MWGKQNCESFTFEAKDYSSKHHNDYYNTKEHLA